MPNEVALARIKIALDIIADVDRRTLFRSEAEELDSIEDRLLAIASRISDARHDKDFAVGRNSSADLPN